MVPPPQPEGVGVLVLRVWVEGTELRGRVLATTDVMDQSPGPVAAVASVDAAVTEVRRWFLEFLAQFPSP